MPRLSGLVLGHGNLATEHAEGYVRVLAMLCKQMS
jgi:hypothetical protein